MNPLSFAAKQAWMEFVSTHAEPDLDDPELWDSIVREVLRGVMRANLRDGERPIRAACLVSGAIFAAIGEWKLAEAFTGGQLQLQEGEPFFILRAQDRLAPEAVRAWINLARIANVPDHKIDHAELTVEEIERWPGDKKYPD